ncbi:hypothetical protein ACE6H2_020505 [Prunus campanulata]
MLQVSKPLTGGRLVTVDLKMWEQAHLHVLDNIEEVQPFIEMHMACLKLQHPHKLQKWLKDEHNRTFIYWLQNKVLNDVNKDERISQYLKCIAQGPHHHVLQYPGYLINGCRFHTKERDNNRVNQNSGVSIVATTMHCASAKDKNPIFAEMCYYGVITEIWELDYQMINIPVFKCDWVESNRGIKVELGVTLVNLNRMGHKSDSFILASQAKQVFYVPDQLDSRWSIVLSSPQTDYLRTECDEEPENIMGYDPITQVLPYDEQFDAENEDNEDYARSDCEGNWISKKSSKKSKTGC